MDNTFTDSYQAHFDSTMCEETQTLDIIKTFNTLYESKLLEIDNFGGGDNLEHKVRLQHDWIRDLTEQNHMLVKVVEQLEHGAAVKVSTLQEKLISTSATCDQAHTEITKLVSQVKEFEKKLNESPTAADIEEVNCRLALKEEELNSVQRGNMDTLALSDKQSLNSRGEYPSTVKNKSENGTIDVQVANLIQIANNECTLLYSIGSEINKLLSDLFVKDKEILNLRNMVTSLSATIAFFYNKMKKINGNKAAFEAFCKCASKSYLSSQKPIKTNKKPKSKNTVTKFGSTEASHTELKKKFKALGEENRTLKEKITKAHNELEQFYEESKGHIKEKEEFKRKYKESQKNYTKLQGEYIAAKLTWKTTSATNCDEIKALKNENRALKADIVGIRRENDMLMKAKNDSIEEQKRIRCDKEVVTSECSFLGSDTSSLSTIDIEGGTIMDVPQSTPKSAKKTAVGRLMKCCPIFTAAQPTYRQSAKTFHADCPPSCIGMQQLKKLQEQRDEEREKHSLEVTNLRQTVLELEQVFVRPQVADEDVANNTSKENFLIDAEDLQNLEKEIQEEYSKLLLENQKRISETDSQNRQLKREISQLLKRVREHEKNELLSDERTEYWQKEIENCKRNLMELKNKLLVIKELLQQKLDQYAQLEIEFCKQNESLSDTSKALAENKVQYEGDVSRLQGVVAGLKEELITAEQTCQKLREDYKVTQAQVEGYTKLYEDIKEKLRSTEHNITGLHAYICQLEEDGNCLRKELETKNDEVNEVKTQLSRLKTDEKGVIILKTELDNVFKQHSLLRATNEVLHMELCEIKQAAATYSHRSKINECHIKKFLHEVQVLQTVRAKLAAKNQEYVEEINYFRSAYAELYKKYEVAVRQIEELRHYSRLRGGHSASSDKNAYIECNVNSASFSGEDNDNYSIDNEPEFWVEKVNSITEELETSSKYWESKLSDDCLVTKD